MSRFHAYSANNIALILAQCPSASRVAGYRRWLELGRQVKRGEHGISALAPVTRKIEDDADESTRVVSGFRLATVFDVSQTDGDALPEPPTAEAIRTATDKGVELYRRLEQWLRTRDVLVEVGECGSAHGYYQPSARRIVLAPQIIGTDHQAKTLAHEAAYHVAQHRGSTSPEDAESVAEGAAFVVCSHFGIETSAYSLAYISGWARDKAVLRRNLEAIQRTASAIIQGLESSSSPETLPDAL
jgi:antirestriction protein ArdC